MRIMKTNHVAIGLGLLISAGVMLSGNLALGEAASSGKAGPQQCVSWSAHANMAGVAYDHIVELRSKCERPMRCTITTSTTPQPSSATVAPGASQTVLIWRGSPARSITAEVTCEAN